MKVLIVDDSPVNLKVLRAVLESECFQVVEAADGLEAMAALEREAVDAIISDILMPRMDGYRFCHAVRKNERWQGLPFIFYTATYTSEGDEKLCYDLGADNYLHKPASATKILTALKDATESARRPATHGTAPSESDVMREYSERLVSKLEAKNLELMEAKERLEKANQELALRTQQLEEAGAELRRANCELDTRVRRRTKELEVSTLELEAFSYSVSHDLRAPLRHIDGFANMVLESGAAQLDETNLKHLNTICSSAQRMTALIDALLALSKVSRTQLRRDRVDLSVLAHEVVAELKLGEPDRAIKIGVAPNVNAEGDPNLLRIVLTNLIGNAWKFTSKRKDARIEFGRSEEELDSPYFVRDNGAGFDMAFATRLFTAFHRLHRQEEFEGTGIGLATVQRIVRRHGGRIWAESAPNQGATFHFTLGEEKL